MQGPYCCNREMRFVSYRKAVSEATRYQLHSSIWKCVLCQAKAARVEKHARVISCEKGISPCGVFPCKCK